MTTSPNLLPLPALREDNPRDFLAALGLLKLLAITSTSPLAMSWDAEGHASIHGQLDQEWDKRLEEALRSDAVVNGIFAQGRIEGFTSDFLAPMLVCDDVSRPTEFHEAFARSLIPGLTGQLEYPPGKRRSRLVLEKASKSILSGARTIITDQKRPLEFRAAIEGRAKLRPMSNSPRLNPQEFRSAGYRAALPEDDPLHDIPCFNLLAIVGLSCFPVVDQQPVTRTLGIEEIGGHSWFRWPVWEGCISLDIIRTLLHTSLLAHERSSPKRKSLGRQGERSADVAKAKCMGIRSLWKSRLFKEGDNEYLGSAIKVF